MRKYLISIIIMAFLSYPSFSQTYHYQFAHDSTGNRISRTYQGVRTSEGDISIAPSTTLRAEGSDTANNDGSSVISTERSELRDPEEESSESSTAASTAEKDTTKHGPLVRTQAEKEAYLDSIMAAVLAQVPFHDDEGNRDRTAYSVGAIPLEYGVSGSGGRTYSVPIFTAPDIKYAPALSLVYNSQGGYGYGGYGWDLAGLSSITLASKSLYWDGEIKAADASAADGVFCLDGVRLVTNDDAFTSSSFPLVTVSGHILVAPNRGQSGYITSFTVLYPDGSRATFGTGTDLGFTLPAYPMVSSTSIEGNRIEYHYNLDTSEGFHSLDSISYGFDAGGSAASVIRFTAISSGTYSYYAGKRVPRSPRMTRIVSTSNGTDLYTYSLSYENAAGVKLLTSIDLANSAGEQLPPLHFTYGNDVSAHQGQDSIKVTSSIPLASIFPTDSTITYRRGKFVKGSYNDGLIGFVNYDFYSRTGLHQYDCLYPSNSPIAFVASVSDTTAATTINSGSRFQTAEAVDTDGDGIDEVVRVGYGSTTSSGTTLFISVYGCNSSCGLSLKNSFSVQLQGRLYYNGAYSPYRRTYRWGDFLGNGKTQLLAVSYSYNGFEDNQLPYIALIDIASGSILYESYQLLYISYGEDRCLVCTDIDGDGVTELCFATTSGLVSFRWNGTTNGFSNVKTYQNITKGIIDTDRVFYTDINADGYVDIVQAPVKGSTGTTWNFYYNTGTCFDAFPIQHCYNQNIDSFFFFDINRDGYPDLLNRRNVTSFRYYLNEDGMDFDYFHSGNTSLPANGVLLPANILDYSSMSSFIVADEHTIYGYGYTSFAPPLRHLVQSCDSYGKVVRNTYEYLPNACLNWTENPSGISSTNGYQLRVLPLYVLTGAKGFMSASDTSQVMLCDTYSWWDGVVNTKGLGFCGFSKTRTASVLDNITSVSVSLFNTQKKSVPVRVDSYIGSENATPYNSVVYTFDNNATTYGKMNPRLMQMTDHSALSGVTTTTIYEYGAFDYHTRVVSFKSAGGFSTIPSSTRTVYIHSNNPSRYVLGVVASQTSFSSKDYLATSSMGTKTAFSYDTLFRPVLKNTYKVVSTVTPAHVADSAYCSFYHSSSDRWQYDSHGNVIREESAPSGSDVFVGTSYTYDATGRHLISSTDALGHTTTYSAFDRYGNPSVVTNHKGQQTHTYRDGWGRVTRTVHPDDTVDSLARAWGGIGSYTETTKSQGRPDVKVDYDAAGREVLSSDKRFDGQWQKVRTYYNQRGLVTRHSQPYRGSSEPSIYGWQWIYHYYDSYGRPTKVQESSGRKTLWSYSGTSVTERKDGVRTTRTMNPAGALLSVADSLGTVSYSYRDDGQPSAITTSTGAVTTFAYDTIGRRTSIVDPSAGTRSTSYLTNANGSSSVTETNALGSITTSYDSLGRVTSIVRPDFNTTFAYDTNGCLLSKVSTNGTSSRYTYDQYDRVLTVKDSVPDGKWLQKAYTYSPDGLVYYIAYTSQSGYITTETYGYSYGHNVSVSLPDGTYVYQLTAENNFGQPTSATSGSVTRSYSYSDYGKPTFRKMNNGGLQDLRTWFDETTGNLSGRMRISGNSYLSESFSYDHLNRLTGMGGSGIAYDANNNISSISGTGSMSYSNSVHPYAITAFNATATAGTDYQSIMYTAYGRPWFLVQGLQEATITYNADYARVRMEYFDADGAMGMNYYIGDRYEIRKDAGSYTSAQLLYLGGDAYSAPMVLRKDGSGSWTPYVIGRDYLGSITHIATVDGTLVEERSYDAWGRLRDPATNAVYAADSQPTLFLGRGFCGHEHLSLFGLINMNARLYDPLVGRFLTPDPYIQAPDLPGNFNRYSYCLNNPLKYTDESGEFLGTILTALLQLPVAITKGVIIPYFVGFSDTVRAGRMFEQEWTNYGHRVSNAFIIDMGLFKTDSDISSVENALSILSRFTWELPQTVLGNGVAHFRNNIWTTNIEYYHGATLVNRDDTSIRGWGMTTGSYINSVNLVADPIKDATFAHEYGHTKQSKMLGLSYLFIVGIPSLIGSLTDSYHDHDREWYEVWANQLSYYYHDINGYSSVTAGWSSSNPRTQNLDWYFYPTLVYYIGLAIATVLIL